MMTIPEMLQYCQEHYAVDVAKPFSRYPDYIALRHPNGKWFALLMPVAASKLGVDQPGELALMNLKCDPELNSILQRQPGFFPGYHMVKAHWLSADLAQFQTPAELADLIAASFEATK